MDTSLRNSSNASLYSTKWRIAFGRVLRETDTNRLMERVEIAEAAMLVRYELIGREWAHSRERSELEIALGKLGRLKRERFGFPGVASWTRELRISKQGRKPSSKRRT